MKALIIKIIVCFLILGTSSNLFSQEIQFNANFTSDTVLFPFEHIDIMSSMTIEGEVHLHHDTSLVRVILEDTSGVQYMILEAYPLICTESSFSFTKHCDETCFLDQASPYSLIIQIIDGSLNLKSLYYDTESKENSVEERYKAKRVMDAEKIETMNQKIPLLGMNWWAGDNSIVASYFDEKRNLFGDKYNVVGFDYYAGGIFEFLGHRGYPKVNPNLVRQFDWRTRHGANDPASKYWDSDSQKTGWLTEAKMQGWLCKSCWAFSSVGAVEAVANLFTTYHIDYDLSEQDLLSCSKAGDCTDGGNDDTALCYIKYHGIATEDCFPYYALDYESLPCTTNLKCPDPDPIVSIDDTTAYHYDHNNFKEDSLRVKLIQKGPLSFNYESSETIYHSAVLSGFEFKPQDSTIIWIIKDSKGTTWGDKGFGKIQLDRFQRVMAIDLPVLENQEALTITWRDEDEDGYCFWGIGEKPENCNCPDEEDCDDSNPLLGGYDENFNCTCLLEYVSTMEHISQNTSWNDTINIDHPIMIDSGACLTITSLVRLTPQVKITVNRGGKLILDGGKLTNACPGLWEGIDVLGSNTCQYFSQYFGVLSVINGGIIENARVAVSNYCKQCLDPLSHSGGIINASGGIFRNNQVAFEFYPFRNIYQGVERPYLGSFKRCQFIYDEYLQDYSDFRYFIKLNQVNGITITGCDFIADTLSVNPAFEKTLKYRSGIYSIGSQFFVDEACIDQSVPCAEFIPSSFIGLNYGIYALGIEGIETASIKNCKFELNNTGIYMSVMDHVSITQDTFDIINCPFNSKDTLCGLYLDNCSAYQIEENVFHGNVDPSNPWQGTVKKIGLTINNSGIHNNEIYNNFYDSLSVGILTLDQNRSNNGKTGLQILCNDFSKCRYDISVDKTEFAGSNMGIREYQGSSGSERSSPANNTFSWISEQCSDYFNNCEGIIYWHLDSTITAYHVQPIDFNSNVNPQHDLTNLWTYYKNECCPSHIDTLGGEELISTLKMNMFNAQQQYDSLKIILSVLVDGGSTEDLIFTIQTSTPEEAISLYDELLMKSPYLSDTSMVEAINKENVLSASLITNILTENPQSAKSDTVLYTLDERSDMLSEEQRSEIDEGWFLIGAKELLESEIALASSTRSREFDKLIRYFKNDTTSLSAYDSIITYLTNDNNLESKYLLALEYLKNADSNSAINVSVNIPLTFALSASQVQHHQDFEEYLDLRITLLAEGKSLLEADSLEKIQIRSLFNSTEGGLKMKLKNILSEIDNYYYNEPFILPETGQKQIEHKPKFPNKPIHSDSFKLYPNPASDLCIIEYSTSSQNSDASIQIIDIQGRKIKHLKLNKSSDFVLLRLNDVSSGVYLIQLVENGVITSTQKLIRN